MAAKKYALLTEAHAAIDDGLRSLADKLHAAIDQGLTPVIAFERGIRDITDVGDSTRNCEYDGSETIIVRIPAGFDQGLK